MLATSFLLLSESGLFKRLWFRLPLYSNLMNQWGSPCPPFWLPLGRFSSKLFFNLSKVLPRAANRLSNIITCIKISVDNDALLVVILKDVMDHIKGELTGGDRSQDTEHTCCFPHLAPIFNYPTVAAPVEPMQVNHTALSAEKQTPSDTRYMPLL